jgi:P4 family phage/plasmid primase-like protien
LELSIPQDDYQRVTQAREATTAADTATLAAAIIYKESFAQDAGGKLYRFSEGTYKQHAERYIKRRVKELMQAWQKSDKWTAHKANEAVEYIRADAPELWERPPLDEINVLNGILNVRTRKLREHDPAFLSPVQIPVRYDPEATCPAWEKFVSEVFPEDAQDLAFELAADLITPSRSAQKALLLLGEGSNGKSTYLRALTAFVGSTNVAGVSLHKLESNSYATARLTGKLANICPDLPSTHLTETSVFKAIVGGDDLHAEYKYGASFEFRPYCRLVFSANHVPRSGDASHAFFRRWLVVPFDRTFEPSEQIPREEMDAILSAPGELSGVLNRALDVIERVRRTGFTESESMREAWEEFKTMTDPVSVWLERNTITTPNAFVAKSTLIAAYNKSAEEDGRSGMTAQAFGRAIKRARPDIEETRRTVNGRFVKCYSGIGLMNPEGGGDGYNGDSTVIPDITDSTIVSYPETSPVDNNRENGDSGDSGDSTLEQRHSQEPPESEQAAHSVRRSSEGKGRGESGEPPPDHASPSPASDATASPTASEIVQPENDALSNGGLLTDEEVERVKELRRIGLDAGIARAKVLAERRA